MPQLRAIQLGLEVKQYFHTSRLCVTCYTTALAVLVAALSPHPQDSSGHDALPGLTSLLLCLVPWCSPALGITWERVIPLQQEAAEQRTCPSSGAAMLSQDNTSFYPGAEMLLVTCSTCVPVPLMGPPPSSGIAENRGRSHR